VDEPPETPKRLTVGELMTRLALDQRGLVASKLNLAGLDAYKGMAGVKLDLAGLTTTRTGLTVGDALTSYWRGQLADATPRIQGTVAGQMSQVIAGLRMPPGSFGGACQAP
jgi:hypothetical protein